MAVESLGSSVPLGSSSGSSAHCVTFDESLNPSLRLPACRRQTLTGPDAVRPGGESASQASTPQGLAGMTAVSETSGRNRFKNRSEAAGGAPQKADSQMQVSMRGVSCGVLLRSTQGEGTGREGREQAEL